MLALALVRAKDEGQTLQTSALETLYFGKFTLSTKLSRNTPPPPPPPTQHCSFFKNLALFNSL